MPNPNRDTITGRFLPGPKICTCGSGICAYHREANLRSRAKNPERNKEKRRTESRAYYWANREKMLENSKRWVRNNREFNRRRSTLRRRSGARLKKAEYLAVLDYYGSNCVYCGVSTTGIDHLYPLSKGGSTTDLHNLAPCCPQCNSIKSARPIWVMLGRRWFPHVAA